MYNDFDENISLEQFQEELYNGIFDILNNYWNPYWRTWYAEHESENVSIMVYWETHSGYASNSSYTLEAGQWTANTIERDLARAVEEDAWDLFQRDIIVNIRPDCIDL